MNATVKTLAAILSLIIAVAAAAVLIVQVWTLGELYLRIHRGALMCVLPAVWLGFLFYGLTAFYGALIARQLFRKRPIWPPLAGGTAIFLGPLYLLGVGWLALISLILVPVHLFALLGVICHDTYQLCTRHRYSAPGE